MKKKGLTLVELIISIAILSIVMTIAFNFLLSNNKIFNNTSKSVEKKQNIRLAMEYISNKIMDADKVEWYISGAKSTAPLTVNNISIGDVPENYLNIDDKKIYISGNVIRYDADTSAIVSGVYSLQIEEKEKDLYFVKISSGNTSDSFTQSSLIKKRK
jgi:prepilin-type N-terminal cleavage/methylation domain-containing protein